MKPLKRYFNLISQYFFIASLLFILLNLIALLFSNAKHDSIKFMSLTYKDSNGVMRKALNPKILNFHPSLEYIVAPFKDGQYATGGEFIRYSKHITAENFNDYINDSTWVFGGSTVYGMGVSKNQTIPFYLNHIDQHNTYINFGALGYNFNNDIRKLNLLLKNGYRPQKVIFINGLNDIYSIATSLHPGIEMSRTNFPLMEHRSSMSSALSRYLPIIRYINNKIEESEIEYQVKRLENNLIEYDSNNQNSLNIINPVLAYKVEQKFARRFISEKEKWNDENSKFLGFYSKRLNDYYLKNIDFITKMAKGHDFKVKFFIQPLGPIDLNNQFLKKESAVFNFYKALNDSLLHKDLVQIKNIETKCGTYCYVDQIHYSPEYSKDIAKKILDSF